MCLCEKLYFGYCNLFIRNDLLERYLLEMIKTLVGHLQFMVGQKHNMVGHIILPQISPIGQNVRWDFCLVGQFLNLVRYCPMLNHYFKACRNMSTLWKNVFSATPVKGFFSLGIKLLRFSCFQECWFERDHRSHLKTKPF